MPADTGESCPKVNVPVCSVRARLVADWESREVGRLLPANGATGGVGSMARRLRPAPSDALAVTFTDGRCNLLMIEVALTVCSGGIQPSECAGCTGGRPFLVEVEDIAEDVG